MKTIYPKAKFLKSAAKLSQLPADEGYEVAFAGRSNAGKSSALNTLTNQKSLARTSKTPGRTQLINLFALDEQRRLVDLPGYGYAKVPEEKKIEWQQVMSAYIETRRCLRGIVLVMDARHALTDFDIMMLNWADVQQMPIHALLTKADKLGKGPGQRVLQEVRAKLAECHFSASAQLFSSLKRQGIDDFALALNQWYDIPEPLDAAD